MIKNECQYAVTQSWAQKFERALAMLNSPANEKKKNEPIMWQANVDAVQSLLDEFREEIGEYERLTGSKQSELIEIQLDSLVKLPDVLIKARIAANLSQKELADIMEVEEKVIQQYEARNYERVSFDQILEVSEVLGISLKKGIFVVDLSEVKNGAYRESISQNSVSN